MVAIATRLFGPYPKGNRQFTYKAELHRIGSQKPYFSLTGEETSILDSRMFSCGCIHGTIEENAANGVITDAKDKELLLSLIKWHLVDSEGTPMHYVANAAYHWHQHLIHTGMLPPHVGTPRYGGYPNLNREDEGKDPDKFLKYFKSTTVFGSVYGDELPIFTPVVNPHPTPQESDEYVYDRLEVRARRVRYQKAMYDHQDSTIGAWCEARRLPLRTAFFSAMRSVFGDSIFEGD